MGSKSDWAALVASVGTIGLAIFQMLLAAGLPLGGAAFGGAHTVLPAKLRVASAFSSLVLLLAACVVLARGGLFGSMKESVILRVAAWFFVAVFGLSAMANIASRSRWERYLMAPIGLVLAASCTILALDH